MRCNIISFKNKVELSVLSDNSRWQMDFCRNKCDIISTTTYFHCSMFIFKITWLPVVIHCSMQMLLSTLLQPGHIMTYCSPTALTT